ncbi:MAG: glycosyltransferase [Methylovirgula sp.]
MAASISAHDDEIILEQSLNSLDQKDIKIEELKARLSQLEKFVSEKDAEILQSYADLASMHCRLRALETSLWCRIGNVLGDAARVLHSLFDSLDLRTFRKTRNCAQVAARHDLNCVLKKIPRPRDDIYVARRWYDAVSPSISIVLLNWNRGDMTLRCLENLWSNTKGFTYEIIVVDNGSRIDEYSKLQDLPGPARIIRLTRNHFFGEANNIGVEAAKGRYICLLNNDAFVHEDWLEPLVNFLETTPGAGAVGPRFIFPDGRLQEAGAIVRSDGSVVQIGECGDPEDAVFARSRQVDYVSAACVVMTRQNFLAVLGFDLAWEPAYFEDVDLLLKLRLHGLKTFYCPGATVTHIANATSVDPAHGWRMHDIIGMNRVKFQARWGAFLDGDEGARPTLLPLSVSPPPKEKLYGKPKVALFVSHNLSFGEDERYLFSVAHALRGLANLRLVTPDIVSRLRILTIGRELGMSLDHIALQSADDETAFGDADISFFFGSGPSLGAGRAAGKNILVCGSVVPAQLASWVEHAKAHWSDVHMILCCSESARGMVETQIAQSGLAPRAIRVVCPPAPLHALKLPKQRSILHVGPFALSEGQDVLIESFRKLTASGNHRLKLQLAGPVLQEKENRAYYSSLVDSAKGLPVEFYPNCLRPQIASLSSQCSIYWHAAGLRSDVLDDEGQTCSFPTSIVEAMSAGSVPIVYCGAASADVITHQVTGFHFSTQDQLCELTKSVISAESEAAIYATRLAASKAALAYSSTGFRATLEELIETSA